MKNKLLPSVNMCFPNVGLEWQKHLGKTRTDDGLVLNGTFHRKFKNTEQTLVYGKGHLFRRYSYPLIERRFSSPMVNDYNLCFVGGWFQVDQNGRWLGTDGIMVERVIRGLKPMGWARAWKIYPDRVERLIHLEKQASTNGLATLLTETEEQFCLTFCQKGKIDEMFDLDSLLDDYIAFRNGTCNMLQDDDFFVAQLKEAIEKMRGRSLENFINQDKEPEGGITYYVSTGLFLGFPHETTYAILTQ